MVDRTAIIGNRNISGFYMQYNKRTIQHPVVDSNHYSRNTGATITGIYFPAWIIAIYAVWLITFHLFLKHNNLKTGLSTTSVAICVHCLNDSTTEYQQISTSISRSRDIPHRPDNRQWNRYPEHIQYPDNRTNNRSNILPKKIFRLHGQTRYQTNEYIAKAKDGRSIVPF